MTDIPPPMPRRISTSRRERFSVPFKDVSVCEWIDAQENLSASLRFVIREHIRENRGIIDPLCDPVTLPRKHRKSLEPTDEMQSYPATQLVQHDPGDDDSGDEVIGARPEPMSSPIGYDMSRAAGRYVETLDEAPPISDGADDDDFDGDVNDALAAMR